MGDKTFLWSELENKQSASQVCSKKYKRESYGLLPFSKEGYYIRHSTVW